RERGRWRDPGERWRGGPCRVCQCLPGGEIRCVPYCPLRDTGCPQVSGGRVGRGEAAAGGDSDATGVPRATCCEEGTAGPAAPAAPRVSRGPGGPGGAETPPEPPSAGGGTPRPATAPEDTPRS
ncbi:SSPO protein, partial [Grallaria varia]|nr:SSPO protein [Grallaria varia]